jgi:hypothetical protein
MFICIKIDYYSCTKTILSHPLYIKANFANIVVSLSRSPAWQQ